MGLELCKQASSSQFSSQSRRKKQLFCLLPSFLLSYSVSNREHEILQGLNIQQRTVAEPGAGGRPLLAAILGHLGAISLITTTPLTSPGCRAMAMQVPSKAAQSWSQLLDKPWFNQTVPIFDSVERAFISSPRFLHQQISSFIMQHLPASPGCECRDLIPQSIAALPCEQLI